MLRHLINSLVFKLYKRRGNYYDFFIELRNIFKNNLLGQGVALEQIENIGIQSIIINPEPNQFISYIK